MHSVSSQLSSVLAKANVELDELHTTNADINTHWLGETGKLVQTLKQVQYLILTAGTTSKKEADMMDVWNKEITTTLGHVDNVVVGLNGNLQTITDSVTSTTSHVNTAVDNVNPLLKQGTKSLVVLEKSMTDLDTVIADPNIKATIANTASTTANVSDTTAEVKTAVHSYLHPKWGIKIWNWSVSIAHAAGSYF